MSKFARILAVTAVAALLSGCAVQNLKVPDVASKKGKKVTASLFHTSILWLTPASNLDRLVDDLSEQCGGGRVEGITLTETNRYWHILALTTTWEVAGYCSE
ncbi:MAG TPA: hypothetical protein VK465_07490 [Fibrobacteria bacterium]|nr:hypothetical protein [Fibrobacteria bacterium]